MSHLATVGVLSIGEMGMGIAKLLIARGYRVVTNVEGRSKHTSARIATTSIQTLKTDVDLVQEADYIISIVPPSDALATAKRITTALKAQSTQSVSKKTLLYYLDLNAISPRSAREIAALFEHEAKDTTRFLDGGIIGGAPQLKPSATSDPDTSALTSWKRPSIPLSGPYQLADAPVSGSHLFETLNGRHITDTIGSASGLKMCFASTTKGFGAICIQSFTAAKNLGVLEELKGEMRQFNGGMLDVAEKLVTGMPPKAYRWVGEMGEIADTFRADGQFSDPSLFEGVKEVYRVVADETVLGEERTEQRKRGRTIDDVAAAVGEGLGKKRKKTD